MNYKEREETLVKEFQLTDVNGLVHKAIIVGILRVEKWIGEDVKFTSFESKNKTVTTKTQTQVELFNKELYLGLSITNPTDVYNYDFGLKVAIGRANKEKKRIGLIITEDRSMLGPSMCAAILDQQIQYIKDNLTKFLVVKPVAKVADDYVASTLVVK